MKYKNKQKNVYVCLMTNLIKRKSETSLLLGDSNNYSWFYDRIKT